MRFVCGQLISNTRRVPIRDEDAFYYFFSPTMIYLTVVSLLLLLVLLPPSSICCAALSLPSSSSSTVSSPPFRPMTTTTTLAGSSNIQVRLAKLPTDLNDIRDCRASAYANKSINLPAAKSFCNADQIMRDGYICVIAIGGSTVQQGKSSNAGGGGVLGTADLNTRTGVVNNVYVRNEARQCGLGRAMMLTVEEYYANNNNSKEGGETARGDESNNNNKNKNNNAKKKKKLKLTVMSNNIPAVTLYKSLGYVAPGIYGVLDTLTIMTGGTLDFLIQMEKEI